MKHNVKPSEKTMNQTNANIKMHRSSKKYGIRPENFRITKSDLKAALEKNGTFDQTLLNTLASSLLWRTTKSVSDKFQTAFYTLSNGTKTIFLKVKIYQSGKFSINGAPVVMGLQNQLARAIA